MARQGQSPEVFLHTENPFYLHCSSLMHPFLPKTLLSAFPHLIPKCYFPASYIVFGALEAVSSHAL